MWREFTRFSKYVRTVATSVGFQNFLGSNFSLVNNTVCANFKKHKKVHEFPTPLQRTKHNSFEIIHYPQGRRALYFYLFLNFLTLVLGGKWGKLHPPPPIRPCRDILLPLAQYIFITMYR